MRRGGVRSCVSESGLGLASGVGVGSWLESWVPSWELGSDLKARSWIVRQLRVRNRELKDEVMIGSRVPIKMSGFGSGVKSRYLEFEANHGHYLERRNKAAEKNEEMKA
ncbi:hypothetical protein H5410_028147 [Solanum commersonii]|uniref:Uncharacterized protein n=1 Tax=Solanum commersonii TaxID=4109 RepID=A0A9J5Z447_SOLCO|nr:hypothetical protein H5410_028147 [Solanum commersonii]